MINYGLSYYFWLLPTWKMQKICLKGFNISASHHAFVFPQHGSLSGDVHSFRACSQLPCGKTIDHLNSEASHPGANEDERLMATTQLDPEAMPAARSIQPMFTWCSNLHQMHEFCLCGWRLPFNACHDFTPKWWHDPGDICHERLVNRRRQSRTRKNGLWRISDTFPNYPKRFLSSQPNPLCHHYKQFRHSL